MSFRVELELFHGPLDLLLHLVRKQEVEVAELPLAQLTDQYLQHVTVLEQIDANAVGDFLDVASALIELKSKLVLPQQEDAVEPDDVLPDDEPQQDLVARLLEFKKYRDAATELDHRGAEWRQRYPRGATDAPPASDSQQQTQIAQHELWDLVGAFGRLMQARVAPPTNTEIEHDPTPVEVYVERVYARLAKEGPTAFSDLFPQRVHKSTLIVTFLAVLELVRHRHAVVEQQEAYSDLLLATGPEALQSAVS